MKQSLFAKAEDLKLECVLVQAWKKASTYIRYHNWYSDTLELDYQSIRLPDFINELQEKLDQGWASSPLKVVPAPKSQKWCLDENNKWKQQKGVNISNKLRPLAHVALGDQVVSTAIMLCFADRIETIQGNPEIDISTAENRKRVINYGNRLFCDYDKNGKARHRWGSSTLYRKYFSDYQTFLKRTDVVLNELQEECNIADKEIVIVHSDLSKFYDRVRPLSLHNAIVSQRKNSDDDAFYELVRNILNWNWDNPDWSSIYSRTNDIDGFDQIALPQGLVASGFFANIYLLDFDQSLRDSHLTQISENIELQDAFRYVDDLRLVLTVPSGTAEETIKQEIHEWLQNKLNDHANEQKIENSKTKLIIEGREKRFLVPLSHNARRIQNDISGTFDMLHGTELIGAIEGFFYTQKRYSQNKSQSQDSGLLVGMSDLRDDTASRFAAGRFRRTFRSLRPLLEEESCENTDNTAKKRNKLILSKEQLDERGRLFSAMLIEEWVANPANVRLLRVALDLFPDKQFLAHVLEILRDGWEIGGCKAQRKEVKLYCLAEIFRAGATETGLVREKECLPSDISLEEYHECLAEEGARILNSPSSSNRQRCPWYLKQQIYLYLIAQNKVANIVIPRNSRSEILGLYYKFARFLSGRPETNLKNRSLFTTLAVQSFGHDFVLRQQRLSVEFLAHFSKTSPSTAIKLIMARGLNNISENLQKKVGSLGLHIELSNSCKANLPQIASRKWNPFWEEENLVKLAYEVAENITDDQMNPWQIECEFDQLETSELDIVPSLNEVKFTQKQRKAVHFFETPSWAESDDDKKRFKLGLILRFALRGSIDFVTNWFNQKSNSHTRYSKPGSHWFQLHHGGFHGRTAFAPEWVALSSWMENLLFELFRWPGCGKDPSWTWERIRTHIKKRKKTLKEKDRGASSGTLFLEQCASEPWGAQDEWSRIIRVGIVQSVIPNINDIKENKENPELTSIDFRKRHRRHLSALIEGVNQMLHVRDTHKDSSDGGEGMLDLLIMPELAVHVDDVDSLLVPFVRKHRCIILTGLVYHPIIVGGNNTLINSAVWIIPEITKNKGLQIRKIEQGKKHLTNYEKTKLSPPPLSFRPAQWVIKYQWSSEQKKRALCISASICYDSTDIALNSDLRSRTDLYAVCALNQDVGTFDRMSEANHYNMFQGVIVANNGEFGGSSCYVPLKKLECRQILHLHGQPQAQIAFVDINPEKMIERPKNDSSYKDMEPKGEWKTPPAGWKGFDKTE